MLGKVPLQHSIFAGRSRAIAERLTIARLRYPTRTRGRKDLLLMHDAKWWQYPGILCMKLKLCQRCEFLLDVEAVLLLSGFVAMVCFSRWFPCIATCLMYGLIVGAFSAIGFFLILFIQCTAPIEFFADWDN
jgi:hypothetical protein